MKRLTKYEIEKLAHEYCNMPTNINEKGLKFKFYTHFLSGALWMYKILLNENEKDAI